MTILDSNVWIAFLNVNDSQHALAQKIFSDAERISETIVIPEYVIVEVCTVLNAIAGKRAVNNYIKYIFEKYCIVSFDRALNKATRMRP